jgi:hypothetical protein
LESVLEENSVDEPPDGDGEAALVEGHERDHEPFGRARHGSSPGTFHSTVAVSRGSWPASTGQSSCSRDTLESV